MTFSKDLQQSLEQHLKMGSCGTGPDPPLDKNSDRACSEGSSDCGLADIISQSGFENPDYMGWLVDQSNRSRRWCILADMFFCVFENPSTENPLHVIMLPGKEIKGIVFNSAKRSTLQDLPETDRKTVDSKTISGMQRFQFIIESASSANEHIFSCSSQAELDKWISLLKMACNLDSDLFSDSDDESSDTESQTELAVNHSADSSPAHLPHVTSTPRKNSESSSNAIISSYDPFCQENSPIANTNSSQKSQPNILPAKYYPSPKLAPRRLEQRQSTNVEQSYLPNAPAFSRVIRCHSCKELRHNVSLSPACELESHSAKEKAKGVRRVGSIDDLRLRLRRNGKKKVENGTDCGSLKDHMIQRQASCDLSCVHISASWEPSDFQATVEVQKPSKVKKASSFKERIFGSRTKLHEETMEYGKLKNCCVAGPLQHKQLLKWASLHCAVYNKYLYAFKSKQAFELPFLSLALTDCVLSLPDVNKSKKFYIFKLCQLNARSLFFAADSFEAFSKWVEVLRKDTNTSNVFQPVISSKLSSSQCQNQSQVLSQSLTTLSGQSVDSALSLDGSISSSHSSSQSEATEQPITTRIYNSDQSAPSSLSVFSSPSSTDGSPAMQRSEGTLLKYTAAPPSPQYSTSSAEGLDTKTTSTTRPIPPKRRSLPGKMPVTKDDKSIVTCPPSSPQYSTSSLDDCQDDPRQKRVSTTSSSVDGVQTSQSPVTSPHGMATWMENYPRSHSFTVISSHDSDSEMLEDESFPVLEASGKGSETSLHPAIESKYSGANSPRRSDGRRLSWTSGRHFQVHVS